MKSRIPLFKSCMKNLSDSLLHFQWNIKKLFKRLRSIHEDKLLTGCLPGLIWWHYTSISQSMWISQLGLCVLIHSVKKAIIHRKSSGLFYVTWESFLWKKCFLWYCKDMLYLVNFSLLSRSVPIFHVSLTIIYQLYDLF